MFVYFIFTSYCFDDNFYILTKIISEIYSSPHPDIIVNPLLLASDSVLGMLAKLELLKGLIPQVTEGYRQNNEYFKYFFLSLVLLL